MLGLISGNQDRAAPPPTYCVGPQSPPRSGLPPSQALISAATALCQAIAAAEVRVAAEPCLELLICAAAASRSGRRRARPL
jgi:hypothetical protein